MDGWIIYKKRKWKLTNLILGRQTIQRSRKAQRNCRCLSLDFIDLFISIGPKFDSYSFLKKRIWFTLAGIIGHLILYRTKVGTVFLEYAARVKRERNRLKIGKWKLTNSIVGQTIRGSQKAQKIYICLSLNFIEFVIFIGPKADSCLPLQQTN